MLVRKIPFRWQPFNALDWGVTGLVVSILVGAGVGNFEASRLGILGLMYLYASYLVLSRIQFGNIESVFRQVTKGWIFAAIIVGLGGVVGLIAWVFGVSSFLVHEKYLPYLGESVRIASFVRHPDVVINLVVYALIFLASERWASREKIIDKRSIFIILPLLMIALFSFSKFLILLPFFLCMLFIQLKKTDTRPIKIISYGLLSLGMIIFLGASHFVFIGKTEWKEKRQDMSEFITNELVWEGKKSNLVTTAYLPLKRLSLEAGLSNWPFGIGIGQLPQFIDNKGESLGIPAYDSHSSYFGLWAEAGTVGGLGGLFFITCLIFQLKKWRNKIHARWQRAYWKAIICMLIYVFIEGWVLDGLFFRHHWFLLVLISIQGFSWNVNSGVIKGG